MHQSKNKPFILFLVIFFSCQLQGMFVCANAYHKVIVSLEQGNFDEIKLFINKYGPYLDKMQAGVILLNALLKEHFEIAEFLTTTCVGTNILLSEDVPLLGKFSQNNTHLKKETWLLRHGADPDLCAAGNKTLLAKICVDHNLRCYYRSAIKEIVLLCTFGADPNTQIDSQQNRCLHTLIQQSNRVRNKHTMIVYLVSVGADINAQNQDGNSPLHLAVMKNMPKLATFFLHKGARKNIKNFAHKTPLELAQSNQDLYALLASDTLPPMPIEAIKTEQELQKLKRKIL